MMPTILVTGRDGQLGFELRRALATLGKVHAIDRDNIDFCDLNAVRQHMRSLRPDIVVNAGAYTDVNRSESDREVANTINGAVPGVLAEELKSYGGKLIIHYSTDYVFNGTSTRPYTEEDPTAPINAYGESKLAGELAVQRAGAPHIILRTEWLYATRGGNFLLTILRLARAGKPLRIIADQVGAPTWARMLAEATAHIVAFVMHTPAAQVTASSGIYHLTAAGQTSWHGFTEAILKESAHRLEQAGKPSEWCVNALRQLTPISASEYPTPARRPAYSVLSNDKIQRAFGVGMPDWRDQLHLALEDYMFPE